MKMSNPKLSIITPVFNGIHLIRQCIENFISQKCAHAEHIIIDAGSKDGTVDIIKEYASLYNHIRWISEPDKGQSDAMNKGIKMSNGSIISFLNVDDYYEPNVFNRVLDLFENSSEPTLLYGNCNVWEDNNTFVRLDKPSKSISLMSLLLGKTIAPLNPTSYFYHKSLHATIGFYNEVEHFNMDVEFFYNASQHATLLKIEETWGNFCMLKGSKTRDIADSGNYWANFYVFRNNYVRQLPWYVQLRFHSIKRMKIIQKWINKRKRGISHRLSLFTNR